MLLRALIGVLALVAPFAADRAEACTCMMSPTNCGYLVKAAAVFEATVESIEVSTAPPPAGVTVPPGSRYIGGDRRIIRLKDIKAWRGAPQTTIVTGMGGGDCGYPFEVGTRYLIESHLLPDGRLSTGICGQTRPLQLAAGLVDYLKSLESGRDTRVWGSVFRFAADRDSAARVVPVPGAIVTLNGPRETIATTDADGRFVVTGIAAGKYSASTKVPSSNSVAEARWEEFELAEGTPNACAELVFHVPPNGSVSGLVLDQHGKPLVEAFVMLLSDAQVANRNRGGGIGIETDSEGRYMFTEIPPGRYRVVMNDGGPMPVAPYERLLARSPSGATTFSLGDGESITLDPLVPQRLSPVKVQGTVRDSGGSPVAGIEIHPWVLLPDNELQLRWPRPVSDAEGRFVLELWMNQRYRITAGREPSVLGEVEVVADGEPVSIVIRQR